MTKIVKLSTILLFLLISNISFAQEEVVLQTVRDTTTQVNDSDEVFVFVTDGPEFIGGEEARIKYLQKNIKYPEMAKESGIQGTVYITFVVEKDGSITNVKVLRGIGGGCDTESVRIIKKMPKWKPGMVKGKAVRVQYNMPIRYVLAGNDDSKPMTKKEKKALKKKQKKEAKAKKKAEKAASTN